MLRTESFEAIGWERAGFKSPTLAIPFLTVTASCAGIVLLLFFGGGVPAALFVNTFFAELAVFLPSLAFLFTYRFMIFHAKLLSFKYTREPGGDNTTRLSFINQRGKKRKGVPVGSVEPLPDTPLLRPAGQLGAAPVGETRSSLRIHLQNGMLLELGFPDERSMNDVYFLFQG